MKLFLEKINKIFYQRIGFIKKEEEYEKNSMQFNLMQNFI